MKQKMFFVMLFSAILSLVLAGCGVPGVESSEITTETWEKFEVRLEYLRQQMNEGTYYRYAKVLLLRKR